MKSDAELLYEARKIAREVVATHPCHAQALQGLTFKVWSMSRCAGKAWPYRKLVKLSRSYYSSEDNFARDFRDTVLHEIAHVLTPGDHHGPKWRSVAREIGCTAKRCHTLNLAEGFKQRRRTHGVLFCLDCSVWTRHRLVTCPKCGKQLIFRKLALD